MNNKVLRMMTWEGCYNCKLLDETGTRCNEEHRDMTYEEMKDNGSPVWCPYPIIHPGESYTFRGV